jgi:hypothetical protein
MYGGSVKNNKDFEEVIETITEFLQQKDLTVYDFPRTHIGVVTDATGIAPQLCLEALAVLRARIEGRSGRSARRLAKRSTRNAFVSRAKSSGVPQLVLPRATRRSRKISSADGRTSRVFDITHDPFYYMSMLQVALLHCDGQRTGSWHTIAARDRSAFVTKVIGKVLPGQAFLLFEHMVKSGTFVDCRRTACGKWHIATSLVLAPE